MIQNGYEELWTVLNWTNPGAVGTRKQWKSFVEEPLRVGQSRSSTDEQHLKAAVCTAVIDSAEPLLTSNAYSVGSEGSNRETPTTIVLAKVRTG